LGSGGSNALTPYGVRSVSRIHAEERDLGVVPGIGRALIEYVPGESTSGLFGGNSNWRGPIWMRINYSLVQAIGKISPLSWRRLQGTRSLPRRPRRILSPTASSSFTAPMMAAGRR